MVADLDQRLVDADALPLERCEQRLTAGARGGQLHGAADEGDAAVAERGDVFDSIVYPRGVIDQNVADAVRRIASVEKDHGDLAAMKTVDKVRAHLGGHNRDS